MLEKLAIGGLMHFMRYFFFAGLAYIVFYVLLKNQWASKKIQAAFPKAKQIQREIYFSVLSILIFIGFLGMSTWLTLAGYTQIYTHFSERPVWYFILSVGLLIVWHDTYFYWTHRLLHLKQFTRFHRIHHESHNTTPWTSFSFHPVEAMVQAAFVPLIILVVPFHPIAIGIVITWQMIFNVMGHLGYEVIPVWVHKSWLGRVFNTSTHHNMHHQAAKANYGLYFNVWDTLMKTNHPHYEEKFIQASEKMYSSGLGLDNDSLSTQVNINPSKQ